jgi:hypothetical protein
MIKSVLTFFIVFFLATQCQSQPGKLVPVYTSYQEGDSVHKAFNMLVTELKKGINADFAITSPASFNKKGILFIRTADAARYRINVPSVLPSLGPEGIYINGDAQSVTIIGNSALALQEAVFFYLEQLGYRYLMPGKTWEVIPRLSGIYKKMSLLTKPQFEWREITNGHGYANHNKIASDFNTWFTANRLGGAFRMWLGHSYDVIVQNNLEEFKQHPEYFAQTVVRGTIPGTPKFNVANKGLVDLVVRDAVKRMEQIRNHDPGIVLLSMEPSDDGGFCTTAECNRIGSVSDQVFYLSNEAAKAVRKKYPGTWVGVYAYNQHMMPTKLPLEPNTLVMVANGFNRTEYDTYELLKMWGKKAKKLGVYEYLSVYEWDNDLPGQVNTAKTKFVTQTVRKYAANGATTYIGESVMGWVHKGWGQYLLARVLWDPKINVDSLKKDFFSHAFENSATEMRKLYESWENYQHRIPRDNDMADWLEIVNNAYEKAGNEKLRARINQVKMYLHYLVMYKDLKKTPTKENYVALMHYAHRTFDIAAFPTLPTMVSLGNYTGFGSLGYWNKGSEEWKSTVPPDLTDAELQAAFKKDLRSIKRTQTVDVLPLAQNFTLLSSVVNIPKRAFTKTNHTFWGPTELIIQIKEKSSANSVTISSGYTASPDNDRKVTINIYTMSKGLAEEDEEKPLLTFKQDKKQFLESFSLSSLQPGFYRMNIEDWRKIFTLKLSDNINYSVVGKASPKIQTTSSGGLNSFYFYVPHNIRKFTVDKTSVLKLVSPSGRVIDRSNNLEETFEVEVKQGEQGIWEIFHQAGYFYLEGVPPYYGSHPSRMLVPAYLLK